MKKLYKPFFILLTVTLPQVLMVGILGRIFWFISTELTDEQLVNWTVFGTVLVVVCAGLTLYATVRWKYKKDLHIYVAYFIFAFYLCFLLAYFFLYSEIIPSSIPRYILMGVSPAITLLTLTMPALGYGVLLIIDNIIEHYQIKAILKPFLFMIAIPIFWYLSMHIINLINRGNSGNRAGGSLFEAIILILFIVSAVAFLFLFVMVTYMVLKQKQHLWQRYMGMIVFMGSLIGLATNYAVGNLFGDFSYWGFYLCNTIVCGTLLLPQVASHKLRMLIFSIKGCLIGYSIYFFIVFLPYMPLALPGIIIFGLGALLLVPALLLFFHVHSLWIDYGYLRQFYKKQHLIAFFSLQLLVLPIIAGIIVWQDQANLNQALRYTYQRSYKEDTKANISTQGIKRALNTIKRMSPNNQRESMLFTVRTTTPYLTSLYHYFVLDNLSISQEKVKQIESIFLGKYQDEATLIPADVQRGDDVRINQVESDTVFDSQEQVYRSWIHFKLQNTEEGLSEFYTTFNIPEGSYISDYYLNVAGEKKYGIIADKRAANWIYEQNRIINRDPGVLTYLTGDEIEFKIFPFSAREVRETGIEIVHRTPIDLTIGRVEIALQAAESNTLTAEQTYPDINPQIQYITQEMKAKLAKVIRKPKYYFILDYSTGNEKNTEAYIQRVEDFIKEQGIASDVNEIIGVNFEENKVKYQEGWEKSLQGRRIKGGFYPEYAMKRTLYNHYSNELGERPIFILVTNEIEKAVFTGSFEELKFMNPEGLSYYHLTKEQRLIEHSLQVPLRDTGKTVSEIEKVPVVVWQGLEGRNFYLQDDGEDSIVITEDKFIVAENELSLSAWENGVLLKGMYRSYLLHPEQYFEQSLTIVKGSITSRVMSPLTSFVVLENKAQEKVMLEKQKKILNSKNALDLDTGNMTQMDEPSLLIMICLVTGVLVNRKRKNRLAGKLK